MNKQNIVEALDKFIRQRPGLEWGNYGSRESYTAEVRSITKDLREARTLLSAVSWRDSITSEDIVKAAEGAFSGRLSIEEKNGKPLVSYCTGQYWPTEYRKAVCAVLASALWDYWRENITEPTGDKIRATARRELGRGIASRWFR